MQQSRLNRQPDTSLQTNQRTKSSTQGQSAGADLMNIQRTIGNKAVGSMLTVQTKLTVGPVGDSYEQEADQVGKEVADHIAASESGGASKTDVQRTESEGAGSEDEELQMKPAETIQRMEEEEELQMKPATETIQRMEEEEELQMKPAADSIQRMEEEEELQMKPEADSIQRMEEEEELQMKPSADGSFDAGASIESKIKSQQGSGSKMDDSIQAKMESAFKADFSNVNIHNNAESSKLNAALGAEAFATGNDIFFREGRYNPESHQGQELLGHELTHVIQQRGGK
ncbi:DUF4157 domain-containing protein [Paenibacillus sp. V4I5]|uniref:eCIS core domain-containing protein n=2 Tax=unclassified Paenibacillus TaxID=185978 RepID=UPI0027903E06|nr:DUF4157 domain-containing protein [Paenibacillus sp. V4I5]MDQ0917786.1 hypothetical protein [Paenibacillus sp. V4I5]